MNDKLEVLNNILQTRLRYVRAWGGVVVTKSDTTFSPAYMDNLFTITWNIYQGEPENTALFQATTYPVEMIDRVINEQRNKLRRDIPDNEKELLRAIL